MVAWGGGMRGCTGGQAWFYSGGHAWFYLGGRVWFYSGGVHGFIRGWAWFYLGGVHGFIRGDMVLFGGHGFIQQGGVHGFIQQGGHAWFFSFFGYNEIQSMSGRYASYWNAFLFGIFLPWLIPRDVCISRIHNTETINTVNAKRL